MGIFWEVSWGVFLLVTVFLGGGAAYLTGRAVAVTWQGFPVLILYLLLLNAAVRFIHFALFNGTLLDLHYYAADFVVLLLLGGLGFRITRTVQMSGQYPWLYSRTGPLTWGRAADREPPAAAQG